MKQTLWLFALLLKSWFHGFLSLTQYIQLYFQNENILSQVLGGTHRFFKSSRLIYVEHLETKNIQRLCQSNPTCKGSDLAGAPVYNFVGWSPYSSITFTLMLHLNRHTAKHTCRYPEGEPCTYLRQADSCFTFKLALSESGKINRDFSYFWGKLENLPQQ